MKIKNAKSIGKQKVYSLEMAAPYHNYVLPNGLVSANSHSVSYAINTYHTAFLKANYPAEFWAAQLSYESDQVKINRMIMEARNSGVEVLPVSINSSSLGYEVESPTAIRRSFGTLKAVGGSAIEELCTHRPYSSIIEFLQKCNMRKLNKKTVHALICAGAFDEFGFTRKTLAEKIQDCKAKLDKWCKRHLDAYVKFAGAHKKCISQPKELDLVRLADPTDGDEEKLNAANPKYKRLRYISQLVLERWQKNIKELEESMTVISEEEKQVKLKELILKWEKKANQILQENEWDYPFVENEEDKKEWDLETIITNEKAVYGTSVSAHIFDSYKDIENKVMDRYPTNYFSLDSSIEDLGAGSEVVLMVEVIELTKQFPYKKDPTKFVRLFTVEDRFGSVEITMFDQSYDDFIDFNQTPVRPMSPGNILVIKAKVNLYAGRKSLVYDRCLKLIALGKK